MGRALLGGQGKKGAPLVRGDQQELCAWPGVGVEKSTDQVGEVASLDAIPRVGHKAVGNGKPPEGLR